MLTDVPSITSAKLQLCRLLLEVLGDKSQDGELSVGTPFQSVRPAIRTPFSAKAMHRHYQEG